MQKRFTKLSFIIGSFFTIVSIILITGYFINSNLKSPLNLYAAMAFIIFGLMMMLVRLKHSN